jgi:hypothetical protein
MIIQINEAKIFLKDKNLENKYIQNVILCVVMIENKYKLSMQQFLPLLESEIQVFLHPA